jgi:hypothetical protein
MLVKEEGMNRQEKVKIQKSSRQWKKIMNKFERGLFIIKDESEEGLSWSDGSVVPTDFIGYPVFYKRPTVVTATQWMNALSRASLAVGSFFPSTKEERYKEFVKEEKRLIGNGVSTLLRFAGENWDNVINKFKSGLSIKANEIFVTDEYELNKEGLIVLSNLRWNDGSVVAVDEIGCLLFHSNPYLETALEIRKELFCIALTDPSKPWYLITLNADKCSEGDPRLLTCPRAEEAVL